MDLEVRFGHDNGIKFKLPFIIPGIGSTNVAKNNWEGIGVGSAISGCGLTIGENVVGMDVETEFKDGRVVIEMRPDLAPNHVARIKELNGLTDSSVKVGQRLKIPIAE